MNRSGSRSPKAPAARPHRREESSKAAVAARGEIAWADAAAEAILGSDSLPGAAVLFLAALAAPDGPDLPDAWLLLPSRSDGELAFYDRSPPAGERSAGAALFASVDGAGTGRGIAAGLLRPSARRGWKRSAGRLPVPERVGLWWAGLSEGGGRPARIEPTPPELHSLIPSAACRVVALRAGREVIGLLLAGVPDGDVDPERLRLADRFARCAGAALGRARGRDRVSAQARSLLAIERVAGAGLGASRLEDLLGLILREAAAAAGAAAGTIWIVDAGTGRPRLAGRFPPEGQADPAGFQASWGPSVEEALRTGRPAGGQPGAGGRGDSPLAIPLAAFDETFGVLALRRAASGRLARGEGEPEGAALRILCALAASAIHTSRLFGRAHASANRLQEAQRELLRSEKLACLGEMSAKVAHEIRNPLSAIGGFARRIEKGLAEDDPSRSYAGIIIKEIARLEALVGEQLEFTKAAPPRFEMIDLVDLLRETIELVREEAERKGVRLIRRGGGAVPSLLLDPDRVKQVILNVLKNAVAATRHGQEIQIGARASEGWAEIEIANNGERIPGEILESLFVPFATAREGGCGLGMAVADQIIKEHGGEIRLRSTKQWSAVFTISLPIRTNDDRRRAPDRRRRGRRRIA